MDKEIELKPCPFCGENAKIIEEYDCMVDLYFYFIECSKCGATFYKGDLDKSNVVKKWNRRIENG